MFLEYSRNHPLNRFTTENNSEGMAHHLSPIASWYFKGNRDPPIRGCLGGMLVGNISEGLPQPVYFETAYDNKHTAAYMRRSISRASRRRKLPAFAT
jgi:hypothetical protein